MANLKDLIVNGSARILGTIYGNLTGNVTGNVSGSAGSCTGNAATATKATQDASGNVITTTYATKTEVNAKGTYSKPSGGIPKTDLASAVQTSLGKADSALQSFTETDPTVPAHVKSITEANISTWNGKQAALNTNQLNAANSGITSTKVSTYDGYAKTIAGKQATLVSGTNIKTVNGESLLGSGDLEIKSSSDELNISACLFDVKWADHLLENVSWLRADTFSWHSGDVYIAAYNELVSEYNKAIEGGMLYEGSVGFYQSPKGFKIAPASEEQDILDKYREDGIAWYYILDTTNKRFKLPRTKFGFEGVRSTVGFDIDESLPNITGTVDGGRGFADSATGAFKLTNQNGQVSTSSTARNYNIGFDASHSSSTYQDNAPVQERATQMYLYFYVGEFTQNANLIDVGRIAELISSKADIDSLAGNYSIIKTFVDGTEGYRIWADGYCEQWGITSNATTNNITFVKKFKNTDYHINFLSNAGHSSNPRDYFTDKTNVSCTLGTYSSSIKMWKACGYLAEGEY